MSLAPRLPTEYLGDSEALEHPVPASASPEMFLGGFTSPWMGLGKIMSWAAFVPGASVWAWSFSSCKT